MMLTKFRRYLVSGLIVLLPAILALYALHFVFTMVDQILGPLLTDIIEGILVSIGFLNEEDPTIRLWTLRFEERIPGIGALFMVFILVAVGYYSRRSRAKRAIQKGERFFQKIPIARSVYNAVQQVLTTFMHDRTSFKKVVLVQYPREGMYKIGFLTGTSRGEVQDQTRRECLNVFLPTTPNPTSGWLVIVPADDIIPLEMTVEQGLKYIISGGVIVPEGTLPPPLNKEHGDARTT